jgi:hypothetical protein
MLIGRGANVETGTEDDEDTAMGNLFVNISAY